MYGQYKYAWYPKRLWKIIRSFEAEIIGSNELLHGFWEPNSDPLQEQQEPILIVKLALLIKILYPKQGCIHDA